MPSAAVFVIPEYSGSTWPELPNLRRGAQALAELLGDARMPGCESVEELWRVLRESVDEGGDPLLVYVGGHGVVHARRHYTALSATPQTAPDSWNAVWSEQLGEALALRARDVLIVLDSCFAGEAIEGVYRQALASLADLLGERSFGVLTSCRAFEPASDGVFIERLLELIERGPVHDVNAWGPGDERIPTNALADELNRVGGPTRYVEAGALRLIPNPRWNAAEPEGRVDVKAALRRVTRDGREHLLAKSAGFIGRASVRRELVAWLSSEPSGVFAVTGGPGTGKSALMGILARQSVGDPVALALDDAPPVPLGVFDVIVHARQKTLEAVRSELAGVGEGGVVQVDALDEAVVGEAPGIAAELASLARAGAAILIGTRPDPALARAVAGDDALLRELHAERVANLDDAAGTRADIAAMVRTELRAAEGSPYRADGVPLAEIADECAALASPSFLFAQATARWLGGRAGVISDEPDWRERLAHSAGEAGLGPLVDEDLASRYGDDFERVRDLLRAAAWAEGLGLPRYGIWPAFAEVLSGRPYADADVTWLLDHAGWYLTEASEDGQSVYRPLHQALSDHLRGEADAGVQARLVARLRELADGDWAYADPYVRHYLIGHAEQAGDDSARELLADRDFVAHADADRVAHAVRLVRGPVDVELQLAVHLLEGLTPSERHALLALSALQQDLPAPPPEPGAPWWPGWARWRPADPHLTLTGHEAAVTSIAFSSDGVLLASADTAGTVRVVDARSGALRYSLRRLGDSINALAFSPEGAMLAGGSEDGTVRFWDAQRGVERCRGRGHEAAVTAVAFSPDGGTLASADKAGMIRLWDGRTGEDRLVLGDPGGAVWALAFSPNGAMLASGGEEATELWQLGATRQNVLDGGRGVTGVAFSPDGECLAGTGSRDEVRVWGVHRRRTLRVLESHAGGGCAVAFSPDGATVASAHPFGALILWDVIAGVRERDLEGHEFSIDAVAFSPDGAALASGGADRTMRLWDVSTPPPPARPDREPARSVAFSPDGALLAGFDGGGSVILWAADTGELRRTLTSTDQLVTALVFSPDGRNLARGGMDGELHVWGLRKGKRRQLKAPPHGWLRSVAYAPDGATLAVCSGAGLVVLCDARTGKARQTLEKWNVRAVAFDPDGTTLATADEAGAVDLWEARTGAHRHTATGHAGEVNAVAYAANRDVLASAGEDGTVRLWEPPDGALRTTLAGDAGELYAVTCSPDGRTIAAGGDDRIVLWRDGERYAVIPTRSRCGGLAWSRDRLAIGAHAGIAVLDVRPPADSAY